MSVRPPIFTLFPYTTLFRSQSLCESPAGVEKVDEFEMSASGQIHVYTGDGKGKTTAAIGLAVRAAGAGFPVMFIQFDKGSAGEDRKSTRLNSSHANISYAVF